MPTDQRARHPETYWPLPLRMTVVWPLAKGASEWRVARVKPDDIDQDGLVSATNGTTVH